MGKRVAELLLSGYWSEEEDAIRRAVYCAPCAFQGIPNNGKVMACLVTRLVVFSFFYYLF